MTTLYTFGETNLTVEVARVHGELTAFRDQLLPALLGPCEAHLENRAQDPSRWPIRVYGYDDLKPDIEIDEDTGHRFVLVNLVRSGQKVDIKSRLGCPIVAGPGRQSRRLTWEWLAHALRPAGGWSCPAPDLRGYLRSKALGHAVRREHRREFGVPSRACGGPDVSESGGMP